MPKNKPFIIIFTILVFLLATSILSSMALAAGNMVTHTSHIPEVAGTNVQQNQTTYSRYERDMTELNSGPRSFETDETDEEGYWNATVLWNGVKLNSTSNLNPNTQVKTIGSYIDQDNIDYDYELTGDELDITYGVNTNYAHGTGNNDGWQYKTYHTAVAANSKYLKFYDSIAEFDCDSFTDSWDTDPDNGLWLSSNADGRCVIDENNLSSIQTSLNLVDDMGIHPDYVENKRAFIILRGFYYRYNSGNHKHEDVYVKSGLQSAIPDENDDIHFEIQTGFRGDNRHNYTVKVLYTIGVYDPNFVTVTNLDDSSSDAYAPDSGSYSQVNSEYKAEFIKEIETAAGISSFDCDSSNDYCAGESLPVFVGLSNWGFDKADGKEQQKVMARARIGSYDYDSTAGGDVMVNVRGSLYREDTLTTSESVRAPNKMRTKIISCKNSSVCRAVYNSTDSATASGSSEYDEIDVTVSDLSD